MNKFQAYKKLRQELAADYEKEIKDVKELLESGLRAIEGPQVTISFDEGKTLASMGEARKIFREEVEASLRLILERYERNLRREVASLGIVGSAGKGTETSSVQDKLYDISREIYAAGHEILSDKDDRAGEAASGETRRGGTLDAMLRSGAH